MFKIYFSIGTPVEHGVLNPLLTAEKLKKIDALHDVYDLLMPTNYIKNQRIRRMGYKQFVKEQENKKNGVQTIFERAERLQSHSWRNYNGGFF